MALRSERYKVGLFLMASGVLMLGFLAFVVGKSFFREELEFFIRFQESVKGLTAGAQVNYHGVPVGSVSRMRLEGDTAVVCIEVNPEVCMVQKEVTKAFLERNAVTGMATIALEGYAAEAECLADGEEIPSEPSWGSEVMMTFPKLMKEIPQTLKSINEAAASLDRLLGGDMRERVVKVIEGLDGLSRRAGPALDRLSADSEATLQAVREKVAELGKAVAGLEKRIGKAADETGAAMAEASAALRSGRELVEGREVRETLTAVRDAAAGLKKTVKRMEEMSRRLERDLGGALRELGPLATRLSGMAGEVGNLAAQLRNHPSALIWAEPRPERPIPGPAPARKEQ